MVLGNELLGFEGGTAFFVAGQVVRENIKGVYYVNQLPWLPRLSIKHIFLHKYLTE